MDPKKRPSKPTRKQPARGTKRKRSSSSDERSPSPPERSPTPEGERSESERSSTSGGEKPESERTPTTEGKEPKPEEPKIQGPFPNEIITMIMKRCLHADFSSFINCLQLCKDWHEVGQPIPWQDIYVSYNNYRQVGRVLNRPEARFIQSITFNIEGFILREAPALGRLMTPVSRLINLKSVSITGTLGDFNDWGDGRSLYALCHLLELIPNCVEYLELRKVGLCDDLHEEDNHADNLEELYISYTRDSAEYSCDASDRHLPRGLVAAAQAALGRGQLLKLKLFRISGKPENQFDSSSGRYFDIYSGLDILRNTQTCYPTSASMPNPWVRVASFTDHGDLVEGSIVNLMSPPGDSEEIFLDYLERNPWSETLRKVRLPSKLAATRDYPFIHVPTIEGMVQRCEDYETANPDAIKLWFFERVQPHYLIHPTALALGPLCDCIRRTPDEEELKLEKELEHLGEVAQRSWT